MRWPIALSITIFLFLIAPFFRKWVELVVWPRLEVWWASRTERKLRETILRLEQTLKEAEAEWTYDRVAWQLTLQTQTLTERSLLESNFLYFLLLQVLMALWKPLATLTGSSALGWGLVFNLVFAISLNIYSVIRGNKKIDEDRTMHTEVGRHLLQQRIDALKANLT